MLADHDIDRMVSDKVIGLTPYDQVYLNPASVDLTLHPTIRLPRGVGTSLLTYPEIDMQEVREDYTFPAEIGAGGWVMYPGAFLLAATCEVLSLPDDIVARVEGKSSIGRVGLAVHITAGFIDPGFEGQITLEIANLAPWPIRLHPHMRIAQVAFSVLDSPAHAPYGARGVGHYQGQIGPTESRFRMA